jgi:hypothetical protein
VYTGFWWQNLTVRDQPEHPGIDRRIILRLIFRIWTVGIDWIDVAQDTDRWQAVVNAVMNLWVP